MLNSSSNLNRASSIPTKFFLAALCILVVLLANAFVLPPDWTEVKKYGLFARYSHGMAYDSKRNRVIVFGGQSGSGSELSDHWEWDGNEWKQYTFTTANPYKRNEFAMTYDSKRKKVVLFGGWKSGCGNPYQDDTWEWDGKAWKEKSINGPSGRSKHAMVYDTKRKVVVLYGGCNSNNQLNDTWTYNGKKWKEVGKSQSPPGLLAHAMAYDVKRKQVVLFGNYSDKGYNGDTWAWNGKKWKKVSSAGPSPRDFHAMAYDEKKKVIVMFGGMTGDWPDYEYLNDTWIWNGKQWEEVEVSGPSARQAHTMVYHRKLKQVVLFGGKPGAWQALNDLWLYAK